MCICNLDDIMLTSVEKRDDFSMIKYPRRRFSLPSEKVFKMDTKHMVSQLPISIPIIGMYICTHCTIPIANYVEKEPAFQIPSIEIM